MFRKYELSDNKMYQNLLYQTDGRQLGVLISASFRGQNTVSRLF